MGKCPYCSKELHIEGFFEVITKETKKGEIKTRLGDFKGESTPGGFSYRFFDIIVKFS